MKVVEHPLEAYAHIDHWRRNGSRIGLVPTMGALHAGHYALVRKSVEDCDVTAASIFVNPAQFGPHEDFSRYPRTLQADLDGLRECGVDLVFTPTKELLYPEGYSTVVQPPKIANELEGKFRPDHFRGVVTVVLKLFQILPATKAYFGKKDYQQFRVIERMVEDLNIPVRVEPCETVREPDGLALSSRNRYLSTEQRAAALSLWKALQVVQEKLAFGNDSVDDLQQAMVETLYSHGADRIDYARIVRRDDLTALSTVSEPAVAVIAAHVGSTRLIDNLELEL